MSMVKKGVVAIVDGLRSPIGKAGGMFKSLSAAHLGTHISKELLAKNPELVDKGIDEVIFGNVAQPADCPNIAKVIALLSGLPVHVPAYTVHRNCASGLESIANAANHILLGRRQIILAGGVESMSNIPLLYNKEMTNFFIRAMNPKANILQKIRTLLSFRLRFLKPIIGVEQGLTDPVCGLNMGQTAEVLSKEFDISREEQDAFALLSHQKAIKAQEDKLFEKEICSTPQDLFYKIWLSQDEGPRKEQNLAALAKLRPYFDRKYGTVTVGNSCSINDGAAAVLLANASLVEKLKLNPLGFLIDYEFTGLEPRKMGLGPVYATAKLLERNKLKMDQIDRIELNEAFAAQVIANEKAFISPEFCKNELGLNKTLGAIDRKILNVNGGAIALGHPVGMTGTRIVLTLLHELRRKKLKRGIATLCIGGGQGASFLVETA